MPAGFGERQPGNWWFLRLSGSRATGFLTAGRVRATQASFGGPPVSWIQPLFSYVSTRGTQHNQGVNTLIHTLMSYIWGVLAVVGVIVGAFIWLGMAIWDGIKGIFRRIGGEAGAGDDPHRPG
jgi:hypothetical protein